MPDPLFGLLILDRDPFTFADFPGLFQAWCSEAGGFVFAGLCIYLLYAVFGSKSASAKERMNVPTVMLFSALIALFCYVGYYVLALTAKPIDAAIVADATGFVKYKAPTFSKKGIDLTLMFGGLFALIGATTPFALRLGKLRWRRIFALAKLSVLEVYRRRIVVVVLLVFIPIFFPIAWFLPSKPADELRLRVEVMSGFLQLVMLVTAAGFVSFALPSDVKNQNIYTIVTKPVERFEIIIGRFLGYGALATFGLLFLTVANMLLIQSAISSKNISERAKLETFKARVPHRGKLAFESRRGFIEGIDAGREFNYRKYIAGDPRSSQRAVWSFDRVPSSLAKAQGDRVPLEFTFDIFRLSKGVDDQGVDVKIRIVSWQNEQLAPAVANTGTGEWSWQPPSDEGRDALAKKLGGTAEDYRDPEKKYLEDARKLLAEKLGGRPEDYKEPISRMTTAMDAILTDKADDSDRKVWEVANKLAADYGFFEISSKNVYDYQPELVMVPSGLFQNASEAPPVRKDDQGKTLPPPPRVKVYVKCTSTSQLLGMAEGDLYVLEAEQPFWSNYLKSSIGIWCRVMIVIGLAVCLSTYLAGVVTFLATAFLFLVGMFAETLKTLVSGEAGVKGPLGSANQLFQAQQSTAQDDGSATLRAAAFGDGIFRWTMRRIFNLMPDIDAFNWTPFVSEGFNIPLESMVMNLVSLFGYLFPWFLLGFYLLRSREVAA